jgi:hypothetical protein
MSVQDQFTLFCENIAPTDIQKKDAIIKYTWVAKTLHKFYYSDVEYDWSTKFLFGSYKKNTNVRPPRDIDLLFKIPQEIFDKYQTQDNWPSNLLQEIRSIGKDTYSTIDKISAWWKVVLFSFSDWTHNVEVLPAFENEDWNFTIPNTSNWWLREIFNPRENINEVEESNKNTGITKTIIKMLKKRVEKTKTFKMSSFELENFILSFLEEYDVTDKTYCNIIKDFFDFMINKIDEDRLSFVETAQARSNNALQYENDWKIEKACRELKKIFWNTFPLPTDSKEIIEKTLSFMSDKEEYIEDYVENININPEFKFRIDCEIQQNGFRVDWLSGFVKKNYPLSTNKKLYFKIVVNTVPLPYKIYWKVRNFWEQAKNRNDLRWEISSDWWQETKEENTRYIWEHYVECYCIKDNICVAMNKIFVPIKTTS